MKPKTSSTSTSSTSTKQHHRASPKQAQLSLVHSGPPKTRTGQQMPAPQGEVKLGRAMQATNRRLGHHHPQAEHGLTLALNLAMGLTWSSPIIQGFIRIVKALFWTDSAEKQKRPAALSQATLLPVPKLADLSQEQLPDSRASPGAQLLLELAERAHQNPVPLGHPKTEPTVSCRCPKMQGGCLCFCLWRRKTCCREGRRVEGC